MKIEKILGEITYLDKDIKNKKDIVGISSNSKEIKKDYIFVAIKGFEFDGHKYIDHAIKNGANTIVYTDDSIDKKDQINYIRVKDERKALAQISNLISNYPSKDMTMIGITGTNGKTTTAHITSFLLNKLGRACANIGTDGVMFNEKVLENPHTTPEITYLNEILKKVKKDDIDTVVMECSSHGLSLKRCYGVDYDYGVFTNLSPEHMDFHKNLENYFKAKMILLENSKRKIINIDDEYGKRAYKNLKNSISISLYEDSDYKACDIKRVGRGLSFKINGVDFFLKRFGLYDIYNSLCAIAIAKDLGYSLEDISKALRDFSGVKSRFEFIENDLNINIVVDFAHTVRAFENIYKDLPKDKNIYSVYGINGDRTKEIRRGVGEVSAKYGAFSVVTTDDPKFDTFENIASEIVEGIKKENGEYKVIKDRKEAIAYAIKMARPEDFVLCLGKGEENFLKLKGNEKIPYYEKGTIREVLSKIWKFL